MVDTKKGTFLCREYLMNITSSYPIHSIGKVSGTSSLLLPLHPSSLVVLDHFVYSRTFSLSCHSPFLSSSPLSLPPLPFSSLNTQPPPSFFTITSPLSLIFLFVINYSAHLVTKLHCQSLKFTSKDWKRSIGPANS